MKFFLFLIAVIISGNEGKREYFKKVHRPDGSFDINLSAGYGVQGNAQNRGSGLEVTPNNQDFLSAFNRNLNNQNYFNSDTTSYQVQEPYKDSLKRRNIRPDFKELQKVVAKLENSKAKQNTILQVIKVPAIYEIHIPTKGDANQQHFIRTASPIPYQNSLDNYYQHFQDSLGNTESQKNDDSSGLYQNQNDVQNLKPPPIQIANEEMSEDNFNIFDSYKNTGNQANHDRDFIQHDQKTQVVPDVSNLDTSTHSFQDLQQEAPIQTEEKKVDPNNNYENLINNFANFYENLKHPLQIEETFKNVPNFTTIDDQSSYQQRNHEENQNTETDLKTIEEQINQNNFNSVQNALANLNQASQINENDKNERRFETNDNMGYYYPKPNEIMEPIIKHHLAKTQNYNDIWNSNMKSPEFNTVKQEDLDNQSSNYLKDVTNLNYIQDHFADSNYKPQAIHEVPAPNFQGKPNLQDLPKVNPVQNLLKYDDQFTAKDVTYMTTVPQLPYDYKMKEEEQFHLAPTQATFKKMKRFRRPNNLHSKLVQNSEIIYGKPMENNNNQHLIQNQDYFKVPNFQLNYENGHKAASMPNLSIYYKNNLNSNINKNKWSARMHLPNNNYHGRPRPKQFKRRSDVAPRYVIYITEKDVD